VNRVVPGVVRPRAHPRGSAKKERADDDATNSVCLAFSFGDSDAQQKEQTE